MSIGGVAPFGDGCEAREVVGPPAVVRVGHRTREPAMHEPHTRPGADRFERDLDGGRTGRHFDIRSFPAVREHDATARNEFDKPARHSVAVHMRPTDHTTCARIDFGGCRHPSHEVVGIRQQLEKELSRRVDIDRALDELHALRRFFARPRCSDSAVCLSASR